jgi:hypothetical protein
MLGWPGAACSAPRVVKGPRPRAARGRMRSRSDPRPISGSGPRIRKAPVRSFPRFTPATGDRRPGWGHHPPHLATFRDRARSSTGSGRSTERGAGSTERGRDPRSEIGARPTSADPTRRATLLGIGMLDFSCGSANRRRDGVEECTETLGHRERLLKYKAMISPGPHGACDGNGRILAGVRWPMVGCSVATARAHASGRDHPA